MDRLEKNIVFNVINNMTKNCEKSKVRQKIARLVIFHNFRKVALKFVKKEKISDLRFFAIGHFREIKIHAWLRG